MKFTCDHCQARYQIPDEKVAGRKLKYVCRKCETAIILDGTTQTATTVSAASVRPSAMPAGPSLVPASVRPTVSSIPPSADAQTLVPASMPPPAMADAPEPPALPALPALSAKRASPPELPIWHVAIDGTPRGPMRLEQVRAHLEHGEVHPGSLAWRDGQDDWRPLEEIPELAALLPAAEPEPPAQAAAVARGPTAEAAAHLPPVAEPPAAAAESGGPTEPRPSMAPPRLSLESESAGGLHHEDAALLGRRSGMSLGGMFVVALIAAGVGGLVVYLGQGLREASATPTSTATAAAATGSSSGTPAAPNTANTAAIGDNAMTDVGDDDSLANALAGVVDAGTSSGRAPTSRNGARTTTTTPNVVGNTAAAEARVDQAAEPVAPPTPTENVVRTPSGPELTAAQIREVYRRNQGRVQSCYDRAATMMGHAPDARLQVAVRILPSGEVGRVSITGNDFGGLSACVQRVVQGWQFPASAQGGQTTFPFVFSGM